MKQTTLAMLTMLICTSALLTVNDAYAQEDDALSQVNQFSFLIGDWNCSGHVFAHGTSLAHATTARVHGEKAAGGHWILFRYDEDKTAVNPKPFHIDQYFGYDSTMKKFVSVAVDVGGYFSETGSGWSGNSITFDEIADDKIIGHDIFTRNGQVEISHSGADLDKEGKWIKTDEETCHRVQ
jgi:hypothetical protein